MADGTEGMYSGMLDGTDGMIPVIAHGLLNSMTVVLGTLSLLEDSAALSAEARADLLRRAIVQAKFVSASLQDMVQGLPPGATAILEELDRAARKSNVVPFTRRIEVA